MPKYAALTSVSVEKSRMEIERTLRRYGCSEFGYSTRDDGASIGFTLGNLHILFRLPLPSPKEFRLTSHGRQRAETAAQASWEQACRQRWRALALTIKAKLEAVECDISTVEQEFLAHIVVGDGRTIGEHLVPRLAEIAAGKSVPLLSGPNK
jgi:hypothetical protein